jgi:hypothetical protein
MRVFGVRGDGAGRPRKPEGQVVRPRPSRMAMQSAEGPLTPRSLTGPPPAPLVHLSAAGRTLWTSLWESSAATFWSDADIPMLTRMVTLQSDHGCWTDARLMAELRLLEDRCGANPAARALLGLHRTQAPALAPTEPPIAGRAPNARKAAALRLLNNDGPRGA